MAQMLYLKASPRVGRSESIKVADAFLEAYSTKHPQDEVRAIDLFTKELPTFDGFTVQAKYDILHGKNPSAQEQEAWGAVEAVIEEFLAADKYVFAVPMWNFGIPYRLKQYFDIIVQPGYTFAFSPEEGYAGLVNGRRAFVAYARGGSYGPRSGAENLDLQKPYMETILGFMGINDVKSIILEPTMAEGPEVARQKEHAAIEEAMRVAAAF